jgi:Fic family protein
MTRYIWQLEEWPLFRWDARSILIPLSETRRKQGQLLGEMSRIGFADRRNATAQTLTDDVIETSAIEGETLSRTDVRSSVARRLGIEAAAAHPADAKTEGVVEVMIDATRHHAEALTAERLFRWHRQLFSIERGFAPPVASGRWRDDSNGPMQVVSSRSDRVIVHYEAPPAERMDTEMRRFLYWFNLERQNDGLIRSAIAHLWFVTVHPFHDGNGRIARAVGDMSLAQDEDSSDRFYSISRQIRIEKSDYYDVLERSQKGDLDITAWLAWFLGCYSRAIDNARDLLGDVLFAARFWETFREVEMSDRQRKVLARLLDGLEGAITTRKWAKLGKTSPDTALREIADLIEKGILVKNPGGSRASSYSLSP